MYVVEYYMTGGTFAKKKFDTLHDATMFVVYTLPTGAVHAFYKEGKKYA